MLFKLMSRPFVFLTAFALGLAPTLLFSGRTEIQKPAMVAETRGFSPVLVERSNCVSETLVEDNRDPIDQAIGHSERYAKLIEARHKLARKHAKHPSSKTATELEETNLQLSETIRAYRRLHERALNGTARNCFIAKSV